jgi:hypothetical protein
MNTKLSRLKILKKRKAINKELIFICKKWDEACQENDKEKMKSEYDAYENDKRFEQCKEEGKDLMLAIGLGDFKLKLRENDVKNTVKLDIWKPDLLELQSYKNRLDDS